MPYLVDKDEVKAEIKRRGAMLARWTTDWDCDEKTEWWYCVIDRQPALETLGRKQRYRISKGDRLIEVSLVEVVNEKVATELYDCAVDAFSDYPKKNTGRRLREKVLLKIFR